MRAAFFACTRGAYWTLLMAVFGLLQFWVNWGIAKVSRPESSSFFDLTKDGGLLFFVVAVIVGISIDFHFDAKKSGDGALWKTLPFVFLPMFVLVIAIVAYIFSSTYGVESYRDEFELVNIIGLMLTSIYALIGKTYLFYSSGCRDSK